MRETVRFLLAHAATAGERRRTGVAWNPLSPRMAQDPYPVYAVMRRRSPVHRSRLANAWLFSRHADADAILRDHRRFASDPRKGRLTRRQQAMLPPAEEFTMLSLDPPDHTRLRALVNKAFTSRAVNAMEAHIRATAAALLDEADAARGFDLMSALAQPLPVIVIAEMLGVPAEDRDRFRLWSDRRARLLEPTVSARERAVAMQAGRDFDSYFRSIVAKRRAEPRNDILSALVQAEDEGERLTERETLNMLRLLVMAGNETTTNLIGNGMLALLRNPDQLRRLRDDPGLIPTAVEELLRYDPPAQAFFRRVLADCEVNGFALRKGDNIILLIGAANRDPARVRRPRPARRRPRRVPASEPQPGHPLLPGRIARAARGPDRLRDPAGAVPRDRAARPEAPVPQRRRAARPRVPAAPRRPRLSPERAVSSSCSPSETGRQPRFSTVSKLRIGAIGSSAITRTQGARLGFAKRRARVRHTLDHAAAAAPHVVDRDDADFTVRFDRSHGGHGLSGPGTGHGRVSRAPMREHRSGSREWGTCCRSR